MPKSIPVGIGVPFMRRFNVAGADIPIPTPVKRFTRGANIGKDPKMADIIGRLTEMQATSGGAMRGALDQLIAELSR